MSDETMACGHKAHRFKSVPMCLDCYTTRPSPSEEALREALIEALPVCQAYECNSPAPWGNYSRGDTDRYCDTHVPEVWRQWAKIYPDQYLPYPKALALSSSAPVNEAKPCATCKGEGSFPNEDGERAIICPECEGEPAPQSSGKEG